MSWHYLQELVAGYSEHTCSDGEQSAPWRKSRTAERCCLDASGTACFPCSLSGTISEPSTADLGVGSWMSSLRASRASRSVRQEGTEEKQTKGLYGQTPCVCYGKWDRDSLSWRTFPDFSPSTITAECLATWQTWGLMRGGMLFQLQESERHTSGSVSGSWPTPTARDWKGKGREWSLPNHLGGSPNPTWVEWLMGWPIGWTDLKPLETDKFQQWCEKHGNT